MLSAEQIIEEQDRVKKEMKGATDDEDKLIEIAFSLPDAQIRAQKNAFDKTVADVEILIARVQVLRQKLEGENDTLLVENFLSEIIRK